MDEFYDRGGEDRAHELLEQLFPSSRVYLRYLSGGAFNSLINVMIAPHHHFILRMPKTRLSRVRFQNITAIHDMLALQPALAGVVPKLLLACNSESNALGRQFWLQSHLGPPLSRVWKQIDRCHLATQVANFLADMFAVNFPACGPLVAGEQGGGKSGKKKGGEEEEQRLRRLLLLLWADASSLGSSILKGITWGVARCCVRYTIPIFFLQSISTHGFDKGLSR